MEFRKSLLSAAAAAAVLALGGGAYAADDQKSPPAQVAQAAPGGPSTPSSPPSGSSMGGSSSDQPSASPGSSSSSPSAPGTSGSLQTSPSSSAPPGFVVGKSVTNAQGDKIGTVSKIEGNNVIISVGGFLGIGSHDVSVPWSQLTLSGTGDDAKLQTALTRDELKAMPEYKEPESGSAGGSMRSPGAPSMGGGTGSSGMGGRQ